MVRITYSSELFWIFIAYEVEKIKFYFFCLNINTVNNWGYVISYDT